jgi:hypothetical protein
MREGEDVQEGNGAIFKLVRGLALEDMEVVARSRDRNGAASPEHLLHDFDVV